MAHTEVKIHEDDSECTQLEQGKINILMTYFPHAQMECWCLSWKGYFMLHVECHSKIKIFYKNNKAILWLWCYRKIIYLGWNDRQQKHVHVCMLLETRFVWLKFNLNITSDYSVARADSVNPWITHRILMDTI